MESIDAIRMKLDVLERRAEHLSERARHLRERDAFLKSELSTVLRGSDAPGRIAVVQPGEHWRWTSAGWRCASCNRPKGGTCADGCRHPQRPQRPQPDELSGTGPMRRCKSKRCGWQGRTSKVREVLKIGGKTLRTCPACGVDTKRVRRWGRSPQAEPLAVAEQTYVRHTCECPIEQDAPCEFHPDNYFCHEHGYCPPCAAAAADPESEALKAKLSVPLPAVDDPTDELIEELDRKLSARIWPGLTWAQFNHRQELFDPPLRWRVPIELPPTRTNGTLTAQRAVWIASEFTDEFPDFLAGIEIESAESNYRRYVEERRRRQNEQAEFTASAPPVLYMDPECEVLGHVYIHGDDRCWRCKLTPREQRLVDSQASAW